ncbi:uncharacterized protein [Nicotiana tomentosiformis]|uniref:uncharacterized protein n=1 Tax=Nicotiana tomentosiformis TaxID=4098 RepID=UPI00388C6E75
MESAFSNLNGKIWLFFDAMVECELIMETDQQVTVRLFSHDTGQHIMMTSVYAKCSSLERLELWDNLYYMESDMEFPWLVGGDFNVANHTSFKKPVTHNWDADFIGDPFLLFKHKLKKVKEALLKWSKDTFGDIFKQLAILEDIVKVKEILFEEERAIENRIVLQKIQAKLKKYLSLEEQYWKQKARMTWFAEGDRNTNFFHNFVNGKRKKLQLKMIQDGDGNWIENHEQIIDATTAFYQNQFNSEGEDTDLPMLDNVPNMVKMEHNLELYRYPTIEEVKVAVFELSDNSASGPDDFSGLFYQQCWDIICYDIHNMML